MFWLHSSFLQLKGMMPIPPCFTITAAVMRYTLCLDFSPNSSTIVSSEQMISSLMDSLKVLWVNYPLPYCILREVYGAALPWLMIQDGPLFCKFSIFWRTSKNLLELPLCSWTFPNPQCSVWPLQTKWPPIDF